MRPGAGARLTAAAAVVLVWAPPLLLLLSPPPVAGQGLSITPEQLGAGEAAVVDQFSRFEEILDLSSQSTGGRGRGGRGGTTSTTGGTGFRSVKSVQQLQLATYYLAGSPAAYNSWNTSQNPGDISLLPGVRDQLDCDSCVAQAIAAAIQAATAAAWRQNADQARFNVSAASLYYCSGGGKTCKTGWDLQEALTLIIDKGQHLIRPTACARKTANGMLDNPSSEPQVNNWKSVCQEAAQACKSVSSQALPWLSCSYKSLSSFVDIQRHIRQHGGVLTRITIYDDFWKHFNVTSDGGTPRAAVDGATHPAYNRTADSRSRPLFGHAALIVGYNNTELTWTLLNSYGRQRFTLDGLFKIVMGVAGVAVPDQTFGIECKPAPGGPDDLHFTDWLTPWITDPALRPRKPVDYWDRNKDWNDLNASCYRYSTTAGDTVSSIADAFGVSLQQLVRDNQALFRSLQQVNYTLGTGTQLKDLQKVAAVANQLRLDNGIDPFFVCRTRKEGQLWPGKVICRQSDLAPCVGAFGPCKIVFSEADVAKPLALGTALKVCGISKVDEPGVFDRVAYLKEPRDSQPRALRALQAALGDARRQITQDGSEAACYGLKAALQAGYPLYAACDASSNIIRVDLTYWRQNIYRETDMLPFTFNDTRVTFALLNLQQLSSLLVGIDSGGSLPPQLGALNLHRVWIQDYCLPGRFKGHGTLPGNWLAPGSGWRKTMNDLWVGAKWINLYQTAGGRCGLAGPLPARWFQGTQPSALRYLDLSYNQITAGLPEDLPKLMSNLKGLWLNNNKFQGTIPTSFSTLKNLTVFSVGANKLQGAVPGLLAPRKIYLDDNPELSGCVPFNPDRQPGDANYSNTGITGLCEADAEARWTQQREAIRGLQAILGSDNPWVLICFATLINEKLPQTVQGFLAERPEAAAQPDTDQHYSTFYYTNHSSPLGIDAILWLINGMPSIVGLQVVFREDECFPVNTQSLPDLLRQLPHLTTFKIAKKCSGNPATKYELPGGLPEAAPLLNVLVLSSLGLAGTIPQWTGWTTLQMLVLRGNLLDGSLPEWKSMTNLYRLDLSLNKFSGSLPAAWGDVMPSNINLNLSGNPGISGSIPPSWWQRFSRAAIDLRNTSLTGCRPESWPDSTKWPAPLANASFCGDSEAASLRLLKQLLDKAFAVNDGPDAPPLDCRKQYITCNENGQVTGLSLSWLRSPVNSLSLTELLQALKPLTQLQNLTLGNNPKLFEGSQLPATDVWSSWPQLRHLDLANCGLSGSLPGDLSRLIALAHLNISSNPGITGPLPKNLAATQLQVLDVSGCGLSGPLPVLYAALPLQVLRVGGASQQPASPDASISGPLPPEFGMLLTLRELSIIGTMVTGSIPSAWFDPSAQAAKTAAAQSVLAEMQAAAADATAADDSTVKGATGAAASPAQSAASPAEFSQAQQEADAATRIATAWQRAVQQLASSSISDDAGAAAVQTPTAGSGLSMQQLETLVLAGNAALEGTLPQQLSALQQLKVLNLSGNALSGQLPSSYGKLSRLQQLDLSRNLLSGAIPALWLGLRGLQLLDLASNPSLGGAFPGELFLMAQGSHQLACLRLFGTGSADAEWAPDSLAAIKDQFSRGSKPVTVATSQGEAVSGGCSQFV